MFVFECVCEILGKNSLLALAEARK